ncbi:MAG: hypothetical protein JWL61_3140 [Gemmatimonadetes bacterium]|jgi:hypothetical protein|nr:hypothetical protein [Gemmatimonadota bacterium]
MMRAFGIAVATLGFYASDVHAQNTARLSQVERPLRVEVSLGMDREREYAGAVATVTSGAVAVRWAPNSFVGIRATAHGIRRHTESVFSYGLSIDHDSVETEDRVLALTLETDVSWRIWRDLTLSPSAGAGFSPYVHGRQSTVRVRATPDMTPDSYGNYSRSDVGVIWTLGIAVRYRHLVVEKKAIGLLGAESAVQFGREYYPWTIGYRF